MKNKNIYDREVLRNTFVTKDISSKKEKICKSIQYDIDEYHELDSEIRDSDIEVVFGSPEDITDSIIETSDFGQIHKSYRKFKSIRNIIAIILSVIILASIVVSTCLSLKEKNDNAGYVIVENHDDYIREV